MPPEPLPWGDMKDFFRDRRHSHERPSDSSYLGGSQPPPSGARWRDSYGSRGEFSRWDFSHDYRRLPGYGKQGGWQAYPEESPYGYSIPRSGNRYSEDEGYRPLGPRGDGRYARNYRDNRASFSQREWRAAPWENNHQQHSASSRQYEVKDHRSVNHALMHDFPNSGSLRTLDEHHSKQHDEASKSSDGNSSGMGQRVEKETSLGTDWRPLKWSRTGSLTLRGSESSHSSSSRSVALESSGTRSELYPQNAAPLKSLQGDPPACATSETLSDETRSRKKPRLGWGEGLAKYEKKKVEGPDDYSNKVTETSFVHDAELPCSVTPNVVDKSPKLEELAVCTSPTSLPCVAGPSSPAKEDNLSKMVADVEIDNNICASPLTWPDIQNNVSPFILEEPEPSNVANLNAMLVELLQYEDPNPVSSEFVKSSAQDRLMLWKRDMTKALELTESEIDSLENELKSFRSEPGIESLSLVSSGSLSINGTEQSQRQLSVILGPPSMEVVPSGEDILEIIAPCVNATGITHTEHKSHVVDSPVASNVDEPSSLKKLEFPDQQKNICSPHVANVDSENPECRRLVSNCDAERLEGSTSVASSMMVQAKDGLPDESNECPIIGDNDALDEILASNKATAVKASEVFLKWLPTFNYCAHNVNLDGVPCPKTKLLIKDKILQRKRFLKFKEKVTYLKYRAFLNLWKEDLRLLTARKHRAKSQKKFDQSWILHKEHKRRRSSIRSRNSTPAGSLSKIGIGTSTSNLISDSHIRLSRFNLKMPALILDEKERVLSRFISSNGLVEDPCAVEKERTLNIPWTTEEKEIFIDKLANFGKDFNKIATFLDHKTVADCIEFYYKNHKSESFERTKKKPELRKLEKSLSANTYLVTSGKKWGRELNSVSLDLLGEASAIAAREGCNLEAEKSGSGRCSGKLRGFSSNLEKSSSYDVKDDRETAAADVLAGICGSLSSEAVSSCITSLADPGEGWQNLKSQRFSLSSMRPLTPEVSQNIDEDTCSDESCGEMDPVDWTDEEKSLFVQAFTTYGKDFVLISRRVQTKSRDQCKVFFSKARKCLGLDMICPGLGGEQNPVNGDANSGGTDSDNACVVEVSSVVSSDKSASRMDEDFLLCVSGKRHEKITYKPRDLQGEMKLCVLKSNFKSDVASVGKPMVYKGEKSGAVQNKGNTVDVALDAEEVENIVGHDASKVDAVAGVLGVSGPYVSVGSMVNDLPNEDAAKNPEPESSNKDKADQEISSAENNRETSECDVNNQSADSSLHHLLPGQVSSGRHVSSPLGLSIKSAVNRNVQSMATGMPCMNGDVKLFGQILSKPLSVGKPQSKVSGKVDNSVTHSSSVGLLNVKESVTCKLNGESIVPGCDTVDDVDDKNNPLKSCGFRNGTTIMCNYSSLPDPKMLLSRYPAAFENLSSPSSMGKHTNESTSNGASVFSSKESLGNNGVQAGDKEASGLKLLQRQDLLLDIQKNGDDGYSSKRADDREVKLNVVKVQASGSKETLEAPKLHITKSHSAAVAAATVAAGNVSRNGV